MPAQPQDMMTKCAAVAPSPSSDCPRWQAFLNEATGADPLLQRYLQKIAGYVLTGVTIEQALFFVYGPGGNGKSVFLGTLSNILGDYAAVAPMDTFTASKSDRHLTEIAMLRGARLVSVSETEEGRAWAEARIKQLTGGDRVTARFMRQDNFTYTPAFKLLIVGNHKPVLKNVDDAARRRFNIIPFTCVPRAPDKDLDQKLRSEWPQIMRWAIEGCLLWQKEGLRQPDVVADATRGYFDDQDILGQWIEQDCVTGEGKWDPVAKLFASWQEFAARGGEEPGSKRSFGDALTKRGFRPDRLGGGSRTRIYRGLALAFDPARSGINHD
jgi:putative DNA primase/helicase